MALDVVATSGQFEVGLTLKPGYSLPESFKIRAGFSTSEPDLWEVIVTVNGTGGSLDLDLQQGATMPVEGTLTASSIVSVTGYLPYSWPVGELTLEIECHGPG